VSSKQHPNLEPLALVVNAAATGTFRELAESLERGEMRVIRLGTPSNPSQVMMLPKKAIVGEN
jgi:hypothetical protein